jgi:hypothetical protein
MKFKILILILFLCCVILLFSIVNSYTKNNSKSIEKLTKNKGLLLLYGEAFREGGSNDRTRNTLNSLNTQKIASDSHVSFCKYLKNKYNIDMEIIINTYDTKYENELKEFYKDISIINYISQTELIGPGNLVNNALKTIDQSKYDFVLFTRMDIAFKPYFLEIFNPEWNKIMFVAASPISIAQIYHSPLLIKEGYPSVNTIIEFVPNNHFDILQNFDAECVAWRTYAIKFNKNMNNMDYILDTYFEANTNLNINPIYNMVSRPETTVSGYDETNIKIDKSWYK